MKRYIDEKKVPVVTKQAIEILESLHFNPNNRHPRKVMENYLATSMGEVSSRIDPQVTKLMINGFVDHTDWDKVNAHMFDLQVKKDIELSLKKEINKTDRERIRRAFKALRKLGYFARMTKMNDAYDKNKNFEQLHLRWAGDPTEIVQALLDEGLDVTWSGSQHNTIIAHHPVGPLKPKFKPDGPECLAKKRGLTKEEKTILEKMLWLERREKSSK